MTPAEALRAAEHGDLADTVEIVDQWIRRMTDRNTYRDDRVHSRAARALCASRGHERGGLRGCAACRADVAAVRG